MRNLYANICVSVVSILFNRFMKRNILFLSLLSIFALAACKKVSSEEPTPTLEVEESNSVLIAKHTWTGCGPCGGWGFDNFSNLITNNPEHVLYRLPEETLEAMEIKLFMISCKTRLEFLEQLQLSTTTWMLH